MAFVEYLESCGDKFGDTVAAFRRESGIGDADCKGKGASRVASVLVPHAHGVRCTRRSPTRGAAGARKGLLEKKWTAVVRLQKKVRPPCGAV